jgi:hypothetical protein
MRKHQPHDARSKVLVTFAAQLARNLAACVHIRWLCCGSATFRSTSLGGFAFRLLSKTGLLFLTLLALMVAVIYRSRCLTIVRAVPTTSNRLVASFALLLFDLSRKQVSHTSYQSKDQTIFTQPIKERLPFALRTILASQARMHVCTSNFCPLVWWAHGGHVQTSTQGFGKGPGY